METMRQDCDILSHQFCGQQRERETEKETERQKERERERKHRLLYNFLQQIICYRKSASGKNAS